MLIKMVLFRAFNTVCIYTYIGTKTYKMNFLPLFSLHIPFVLVCVCVGGSLLVILTFFNILQVRLILWSFEKLGGPTGVLGISLSPHPGSGLQPFCLIVLSRLEAFDHSSESPGRSCHALPGYSLSGLQQPLCKG